MALDLAGLSGTATSLDGANRPPLSFNYAAGELQASTYIFWFNSDAVSGTSFLFGTRRGTSNYRRMQRAGGTGNQMRSRQDGSAAATTTNTHNQEGNWVLCMARWVTGSERSVEVWTPDGTHTTATDTTTVTNSNLQSDLQFLVGSDVTIQDLLICNRVLPPECGKAIAMGMHPFNLADIRESLVFYEPLEGRYGEWHGPTLPMIPGEPFNYAAGRSHKKYIPQPKFVPAILEPPAAAASANRWYLSHLVQR